MEIERAKPVEHDLGRYIERAPPVSKENGQKASQDMSWPTTVPGKWNVMR